MSKEPFVKKTESFYSIEDWKKGNQSLVAGITSRHGGVSEPPFDTFNMGLHVGDSMKDVTSNRQLLANGISMPVESWVAAEQTHGSNLYTPGLKDAGRGATNYESSVKDTDGLLTDESGLLLTMCYADCVPLYFWDKETGMIGLAHAGWKGTVQEIGPKMIEAFKHNGSKISSIDVVIGPSICGECYIVDDYVIDKVKKTLEDENDLPYNLKEEGQYHLDLKKLNQKLLIQSGLNTAQIHTSGYCSSCHADFFSYRRDGGKTGRIMSYIGWKESKHESF
ncbi:peptidoglycan editing factor PgeF [Bacillus sp. KH172YL63]|uniref:peptidoglycan editing factor PgeF n=1 Tax=Bacillus sp. KH172YL63 TaxID=2709784 RepID=UPI0013E425FF|nr:peptidoglycan editing factor PgeF [Bacillus sp. KH172YL63]BCB03275.1 laccase domain protein YlmD [Bacillus sp. KH172YL63]